MKKFIRSFLIISIVVVFGYLTFEIIQKVSFENHVSESIPKFLFTNVLNSEHYTNDSIKAGKPCLIIYFNPDCEFCQDEAKQISNRIQEFENDQIIMVSYSMVGKVLRFRKKYHLENDNIVFLHDSDFQFYDDFGEASIPSIFIYNKNGKLTRHFIGETKVETLLKYLGS